jgi:GNAT superfamily N-acetyltransferase
VKKSRQHKPNRYVLWQDTNVNSITVEKTRRRKHNVKSMAQIVILRRAGTVARKSALEEVSCQPVGDPYPLDNLARVVERKGPENLVDDAIEIVRIDNLSQLKLTVHRASTPFRKPYTSFCQFTAPIRVFWETDVFADTSGMRTFTLVNKMHVAPGGIIRRFLPKDGKQVAALIANTLLVSNTGSYSLEEIRSLAHGYSSATLEGLSRHARVWVYVEGDQIQGVVCLDRATIQALFVAPDRQGKGIGRALLGIAEEAAHRRGRRELSVPASLTAVDFYEHLGFRSLGPGRSSGGVLIERMSKNLP